MGPGPCLRCTSCSPTAPRSPQCPTPTFHHLGAMCAPVGWGRQEGGLSQLGGFGGWGRTTGAGLEDIHMVQSTLDPGLCWGRGRGHEI